MFDSYYIMFVLWYIVCIVCHSVFPVKLWQCDKQPQGCDAAKPLSAFSHLLHALGNILTNSYSAANPGYTLLPGGILMQWGSASVTTANGASTSGTINFPKAFPATVWSVTASLNDNGPNQGYVMFQVCIPNISTSNFTWCVKYISGVTQSTSGATMYWMAIGN